MDPAPAEEARVDPVCGMPVDPNRTRYKTVYKGRVYYFCCRRCLEEFERDPGKYAR